MKFYYDLHIHSVLSPCADELMTPNNILNMAMLNELDFIAVTDHNSVKQLKVINEIADSYDFVLIPGVEVQVEGAHVLCYFNDFNAINKFGKFLENSLNKDQHNYEQHIMDIYDTVIDNYPYYLLNDLNISFLELLIEVKTYDGISVLAHIDRPKNSSLHLLNEININYIDGIEIMNKSNVSQFIEENPLIKNKPILFNSDSHQIINISLKENFLDLNEKSIEAFFNYFKYE